MNTLDIGKGATYFGLGRFRLGYRIYELKPRLFILLTILWDAIKTVIRGKFFKNFVESKLLNRRQAVLSVILLRV